MMKKLLALMLVLGMASFANATVLISVNGSTTGPDVISIGPSTTITIDIYNLPDVTPDTPASRNFGAYLDFLPNNQGNYALSNVLWGPAKGDFPASWSLASYAAPDYYDEYTVNQAWSPGTAGNGVLGAIWMVDMHCEKAGGNVLVQLYETRVGGGSAIVDQLTIFQVPEPAMIALLGLGGLFLRRRK